MSDKGATRRGRSPEVVEVTPGRARSPLRNEQAARVTRSTRGSRATDATLPTTRTGGVRHRRPRGASGVPVHVYAHPTASAEDANWFRREWACGASAVASAAERDGPSLMGVLTTPAFSVLVPTNHRARLAVRRPFWLAVDGRVRTWGLLQRMRPLTAVGERPAELTHERVEGGVAAAAFFSARATLLFSRGWVTLDHLADMTTMGAVGHDVAAALWTLLAGATTKSEGDVKVLTAASRSASDAFVTIHYSRRVADKDRPAAAKVDLLIACIFHHLTAAFRAAHEQEDARHVVEERRVEAGGGHVRVTASDAVRSPFFCYGEPDPIVAPEFSTVRADGNFVALVTATNAHVIEWGASSTLAVLPPFSVTFIRQDLHYAYASRDVVARVAVMYSGVEADDVVTMVLRRTHPNLPDAPPLRGGACAVYELHLAQGGVRGHRVVDGRSGSERAPGMTIAMEALTAAAQAHVSLRAFDPGELEATTARVVPSPKPARPTLRAHTALAGMTAPPRDATLSRMVRLLPSEAQPSSDSDGQRAASAKDVECEAGGSPSGSSSSTSSAYDSEGFSSGSSSEGSFTSTSTD